MFSSLFIVQSLQAELFLQYNGELLKVFKTLSVFLTVNREFGLKGCPQSGFLGGFKT